MMARAELNKLPMLEFEDDQENKSLLISRRVIPIVPEHYKEGLAKEVKVSWLNRLIGFLKGQTLDDIRRLKEAGIQMVEAKAMGEMANAKHKLAQADKEFALADKIRISNEETINKQFNKTPDDILKAQSTAIDALEKSITNIRSKGGQVLFDSQQIQSILHLSSLSTDAAEEIKNILNNLKNESEDK